MEPEKQREIDLEFLKSLNCSKNKNNASLTCCDEDCPRPPLVCEEESCPCLNELHKNCKVVSIEHVFKRLENKKTEPSENIKNTVNELNRVYTFMIDRLCEDREALDTWI